MPKAGDFKPADLVNWRKRQLLKRSLTDAGGVDVALDLPCGDGRFWSVFRDMGVPSLIAAEVSKGMLDVANEHRLSPDMPSELILTSAFDIDLADDAVDFAACIDFYPHLAGARDQERLLAELRRVTKRYLAVSAAGDVEEQFARSGFKCQCSYDLLPVLSNWRLYLLRKQV